ncbi:23S rRNA (uracil(747)-C(5))-methyltransferase RlmC [Nocardioides sp. BP30]|uniref:23S rRNA (uracil(747)-C(5))-methyltransferase RlmC n=1 Tax=Nocardioides sp. BP30 TaxID=3036374 RepID=UPI0024695A76|nr:23S rRNA (uracil(747)-C(5))-methyltransferase RlmC [Nocardioides sp. BP30]WGL52040.1 23S rRNA (uracil(747)-C(5))-methyltransferase RlmC [Nocardioides sp. BP30]
MRCGYFEAGVCRSCTFLETPYSVQLARKQDRVVTALAEVAPGLAWAPAVASAEARFRNKAKMVVAGTVEEPTLGILDADGLGVDLQGCGLHQPGLERALPMLARFITAARLTPYAVPRRTGELKHLIVTESPDGELMVRFVLRSTEALARLRSRLPALLEEARLTGPGIAVASVNLQPEHKAILEGSDEIALYGETLRMRVNDIDLHLRPQSFFQTNTEVAATLYRSAAALVDTVAPSTVWDLYCGVGGFGLHLAGPGRSVVGVEISEQAIESARISATELASTGPTGHTGSALAAGRTAWIAADVTRWITEQPLASRSDLVVVNPPRRGIGPTLAGWLEESGVPHVVYSSCNVDSLARDLAAMPSLRPVSAQLLDMFPHTGHHEVLMLLSR